MKNIFKDFKSKICFLFFFVLLFFAPDSLGQRNITTLRVNGETIKKKPIVDSLAEWLSRSDLRKADSCIQVIFNAIQRKDTVAEKIGIKGLNVILNSKKYEGDPLRPIYLKGIFACEHRCCCIWGGKKTCCDKPVERPSDVDFRH